MSIATTPTPIKAEDIRKGDTIRREQPDNPRVKAVEYVALADQDAPEKRLPNNLFLLDRPVVLPTVPGVYSDREGDTWKVINTGRLVLLGDSAGGHDPKRYAPFTHLVPEAAAPKRDEVMLLALRQALTDISPDGSCSTRHIVRARHTLEALIAAEAAK